MPVPRIRQYRYAATVDGHVPRHIRVAEVFGILCHIRLGPQSFPREEKTFAMRLQLGQNPNAVVPNVASDHL